MSTNLTTQMVAATAHHPRSNDDVGLFRRWLDAAKLHRQRRQMVAALQSLNDRMLADIGLHRNDLPRASTAFSSHNLRMAPMAQVVRTKNMHHDAYLKAV